MTVYRYQINLSFEKADSALLFQHSNAHYSNAPQGRGDKIVIRQSSITILADRTKKFDKDGMLNNASNSIYIQILKSLLAYYSLSQSYRKLKSLVIKYTTVCTRKEEKYIAVAHEVYRKDNQPIKQPFSVPVNINSNILNKMWDQADSAEFLVPALSHWLNALSSHDRYFKFERLWRTFERLFFYVGHKNGADKEIDCLRQMRQTIVQQHSLIPQTMFCADKLTYDDVRSLSWRKLILNNYAVPGKPGLYEGYKNYFVCLNSDERIIKMLEDTLVNRESQLRAYGFLTDVQNHIHQKKSNPVKKNEELIALICCKYAYFLRNKTFHGETNDAYFSFSAKTQNDDNIDLINELLEKLTSELIASFDRL